MATKKMTERQKFARWARRNGIDVLSPGWDIAYEAWMASARAKR